MFYKSFDCDCSLAYVRACVVCRSLAEPSSRNTPCLLMGSGEAVYFLWPASILWEKDHDSGTGLGPLFRWLIDLSKKIVGMSLARSMLGDLQRPRNKNNINNKNKRNTPWLIAGSAKMVYFLRSASVHQPWHSQQAETLLNDGQKARAHTFTTAQQREKNAHNPA